MPIGFPPPERGPDWDWASGLAQPEIRVDTKNLAAVGTEFDGSALDPGIGVGWVVNQAVNLRDLGNDYINPTLLSMPNPVPRVMIDSAPFALNFDYLAMSLSGVSRDSTGATLGNCVIDLFLTGTDTLVQSTTSDASGNFWFSLMAPGPYYIVAYKPGSPDVAGTSVNTLKPA